MRTFPLLDRTAAIALDEGDAPVFDCEEISVRDLSTPNPRPAHLRPVPPPQSVGDSADARLFSMIQEGGTAWQRLAYDQYFPLVKGLIIRSLGPMADAEDLIADVFVGFFESASNIRSPTRVRSYVVSITMNVVRRELRRRRRRRFFSLVEEEKRAVDRVPSTDDPKAKVALLHLSRILSTLNPDDHLVFALHVLEDMNLEDVAQALDMSLSTVKRRLRRANERLLRRVSQNPLLSDYVRDKGERDEALSAEDGPLKEVL